MFFLVSYWLLVLFSPQDSSLLPIFFSLLPHTLVLSKECSTRYCNGHKKKKISFVLKTKDKNTCFKDLIGCFGLSPFNSGPSPCEFLSGLFSILTVGFGAYCDRMLSSPNMIILVSELRSLLKLKKSLSYLQSQTGLSTNEYTNQRQHTSSTRPPAHQWGWPQEPWVSCRVPATEKINSLQLC